MKLNLTLILLLLFPRLLLAAELKYELYGYGTKHMVVIISGDGAADLSSNLSSDGFSLRISGIDVEYSPKDQSRPLPSAISQLNQVKRDAYTDFLLAFSTPFDLNVVPGTNELKLVLKSKPQAAGDNTASKITPQAKQSAAPQPTAASAAAQQAESQAALLEQLTSELVRLRAELDSKEQEIAKLKEGCNAN